MSEYFYSNDTGDAQIKIYSLFPGIEVAYIQAHTEELDFSCIDRKYKDNYVGIHFCREGRIEQEYDSEFFYMMPDDCWIAIQDKREKRFRLPLKHYHGISIGIDTDQIQTRFSDYLGNETLDPKKIAQRLCGKERSIILRSIEPLKHIFHESYDIPEEYREDYLKIKILEVLFMLNQQKSSEDFQKIYAIPRVKVELVKKVADYIDKNLNNKVSFLLFLRK